MRATLQETKEWTALQARHRYTNNGRSTTTCRGHQHRYRTYAHHPWIGTGRSRREETVKTEKKRERRGRLCRDAYETTRGRTPKAPHHTEGTRAHNATHTHINVSTEKTEAEKGRGRGKKRGEKEELKQTLLRRTDAPRPAAPSAHNDDTMKYPYKQASGSSDAET